MACTEGWRQLILCLVRPMHTTPINGIRILLFVASLFFAGCASTVEYTQLPTVAAGKPAATIYFIRKAHFVGAATRFDVRVDGFTVGAIGPGRHAAIRVPAGMRSIGTRDMNMTVQVDAGESQYYQLVQELTSFYRATEVQLRRLPPEQGQALLRETSAVR